MGVGLCLVNNRDLRKEGCASLNHNFGRFRLESAGRQCGGPENPQIPDTRKNFGAPLWKTVVYFQSTSVKRSPKWIDLDRTKQRVHNLGCESARNRDSN